MPIDRCRRANGKIDGHRCRGQQPGDRDRGTEPPGDSRRPARLCIRSRRFPISRCQHSPSNLGSRSFGLIRSEPVFGQLLIDRGELAAKQRGDRLLLFGAGSRLADHWSQQDRQRRHGQQPGNDQEPDHARSPSSVTARARSLGVRSRSAGSAHFRRTLRNEIAPAPSTRAGGPSHNSQVTGSKGGSSSTKTP